MWQRPAIVAVGLASTVLAACTVMVLRDPMYRAESLIVLRPGVRSSLTSEEAVAPDRIVHNEVAVLEGDIVASQVRPRVLGPLPRVHATVLGNSDVVAVTVDSTSPESAAALVDLYVQTYLSFRTSQQQQDYTTAIDAIDTLVGDLEAQRSAAASGATDDLDRQIGTLLDQRSALQLEARTVKPIADLVQPAIADDGRLDPITPRKLVTATISGLLLGLLSLLLLRRSDDVLHTPRDLQPIVERHPLLTVLPDDPREGPRSFRSMRGHDPTANAVRQLRDMLPMSSLGRDPRVIVVCGVSQGAGATLTATHLAAVIVETGRSVVLVDADLRRPSIHHVLGVDGSTGLFDALGAEPLDMVLLPIDDSASLLPAGRQVDSPLPLFSRKHMELVMAELRGTFDYVIIDAPAVLDHGDAVALARHADAVVVVIPLSTRRRDAERAIDTLTSNLAPVVGVVFNQHDPFR